MQGVPVRKIIVQLEHYTATEEYWAAYIHGDTGACGYCNSRKDTAHEAS